MKPLCSPFGRPGPVSSDSQEFPMELLQGNEALDSSWITRVPAQIKRTNSSATSMSLTEGETIYSANEEQERNVGAREHIVGGHIFKAVALKQPCVCSQCRYFIWVFGKQAYQCKACKLMSHKHCHQLVASKCIGADNSHGIGLQAALGAQRVHSFGKRTFAMPTFCEHCGSLLYGIYNQGLVCAHYNCGLTIHHKCRKNVASACGSN